MLAIAGMLAASSCVKESINVPEGNDVVASFTINATDAIATKAVGDGTTVDKVACAVYDANGDEMTDLRQVVAVNGKTAYYSIRLAKGQAYRVAFFAYNEAANAYDLTDMKSIKINSACSNVEGRDAFSNYVDIEAEKTMNSISENVTLYRPFAQLNLGVDAQELADAAKAGVVVSNTQVTVTNVYDAFSAYDNTVASDAVLGTCTYALNGVPSEKLVVNGDEYTYLALNYLLVGDKGAEKSLTDVEFVWATADGKTNNPTTHFVNIPVQRNYRTNIIGKLLTNPAEFNISIDADFDGEYVENVVTVTNNVVENAAELQAAINAAVEGQNVIVLGGDDTYNSAFVVNQKKDVQFLIDGQQDMGDPPVAFRPEIGFVSVVLGVELVSLHQFFLHLLLGYFLAFLRPDQIHEERFILFHDCLEVIFHFLVGHFNSFGNQCPAVVPEHIQAAVHCGFFHIDFLGISVILQDIRLRIRLRLHGKIACRAYAQPKHRRQHRYHFRFSHNIPLSRLIQKLEYILKSLKQKEYNEVKSK